MFQKIQIVSKHSKSTLSTLSLPLIKIVNITNKTTTYQQQKKSSSSSSFSFPFDPNKKLAPTTPYQIIPENKNNELEIGFGFEGFESLLTNHETENDLTQEKDVQDIIRELTETVVANEQPPVQPPVPNSDFFDELFTILNNPDDVLSCEQPTTINKPTHKKHPKITRSINRLSQKSTTAYLSGKPLVKQLPPAITDQNETQTQKNDSEMVLMNEPECYPDSDQEEDRKANDLKQWVQQTSIFPTRQRTRANQSPLQNESNSNSNPTQKPKHGGSGSGSGAGSGAGSVENKSMRRDSHHANEGSTFVTIFSDEIESETKLIDHSSIDSTTKTKNLKPNDDLQKEPGEAGEPGEPGEAGEQGEQDVQMEEDENNKSKKAKSCPYAENKQKYYEVKSETIKLSDLDTMPKEIPSIKKLNKICNSRIPPGKQWPPDCRVEGNKAVNPITRALYLEIQEKWNEHTLEKLQPPSIDANYFTRLITLHEACALIHLGLVRLLEKLEKEFSESLQQRDDTESPEGKEGKEGKDNNLHLLDLIYTVQFWIHTHRNLVSKVGAKRELRRQMANQKGPPKQFDDQSPFDVWTKEKTQKVIDEILPNILPCSGFVEGSFHRFWEQMVKGEKGEKGEKKRKRCERGENESESENESIENCFIV